MIRRSAAVLVAALCLTGCVSPENPPTVAPTTRTAQADDIRAIVTNVMASEHLESALVRVTIDGKEVISEAFGESMTGVPASTDMHFRNGAVAISYVSTLLLILAEENRVGLDDPLSDYLPDIAHADRVTLRQLAQMTSGYHDYVLGNDAFGDELYENPFRQWTPEELLQFAVTKPLQYEPGTNWSYAHTNYVLLGLALERATGEPMPKLLSEKVLDPLGLRNTANSFTPAIPEPALHAFTAERRAALDIPATVPFWRIPPTGIRRGPSHTARSRPRPSKTSRPRRPASDRANSFRPTATESSRRRICVAGLTARPDARPAPRRPSSTRTAWASCSPVTGCCRTRCSSGMPQ